MQGKSETADGETRWTMIRQAAAGESNARGQFVQAYFDIVRAFLAARWRGTRVIGWLDDAVQEVFLDSFRDGGALARLDPSRGSFRSFLFGVTRNVALRHEERMAREHQRQAAALQADELPSDEATMSRAFDRAWALRILQRAALRQKLLAASTSAAALRRVELLELRFREGLPIRAIAARWGTPADVVHHEYARAREEFKRALRSELALHRGIEYDVEEADEECRNLLALLA